MSRTVQQTANSSGSTSIVEVGTNTGFNAGDLVYFNNNDYKSPAGFTAPGTASFNITKTVPSGAFSGYTKSVFVASEVQTVGSSGSSGSKFAAVLTNGNIVQVYGARSTGNPYFRVVDTSGTVVVAATSIGTSGANTTRNNSIGCCALTGGGFAVYGTTTAGTMWTAIYSNTGSVVQSINVDSTNNGFASSGISGVALSTGGFAVVIISRTSPYPVYYRAWGATGTAAYNWQTSGNAYTSIYNNAGIAARNDGTFAFTYISAAAAVNFVRVSAAGTNASTSVTVGNNTAAAYCCDLTCLSDGQTYVMSYAGYTTTYTSYYIPTFRIIPSSNTVGSEFYIPGNNLNWGPVSPYVGQVAAVGTGFVLGFSDATQMLQYAFFDSTGTCLSGTNSNGVAPKLVYGSNFTPTSQGAYAQFIEIGSNVLIYWAASSPSASTTIFNQQSAKINKTTYELVPYGNTVSATVGTTSAAVSGVGYANTTPTKIAYSAATTAAVVGTSPVAYVTQPSGITTSTCDTVNCCTLVNGNIVVVTRTTAGLYYFYIYTPAGALVTSAYIGLSSSTGYSYAYGIYASGLQSGNFVVMYYTTSSNFAIDVYSSSGSLLAQSLSNTTSGFNYGIGGGVAALADGDRFVTVFPSSSNYPSYRVFSYASSAITAVTSITNLVASSHYNLAVAADDCGGFAVTTYYPAAGSQYYYVIYPNGASSYTVNYSTGFGPNYYYYYRQMTYSGGVYFMAAPSSSTSSYAYFYNASVGEIYTQGYFTLSGNSNNTADRATIGLGKTSAGSWATIGYGTSATSQPNFTGLHGEIGWGNSSYTYSAPSTNKLYDSSLTFYGNEQGNSAVACQATGNNAFFAWLNSSQIPVFAIVNMDPSYVATTLTAGVSASSGSPIYGNATSVSGAISNTTFAGVAANTAAAGGTGQLIVNGVAQLNSNYSTSTPAQSFDYTGLPAPGVKGSSVGRIVNLQGNT